MMDTHLLQESSNSGHPLLLRNTNRTSGLTPLLAIESGCPIFYHGRELVEDGHFLQDGNGCPNLDLPQEFGKRLFAIFLARLSIPKSVGESLLGS